MILQDASSPYLWPFRELGPEAQMIRFNYEIFLSQISKWSSIWGALILKDHELPLVAQFEEKKWENNLRWLRLWSTNLATNGSSGSFRRPTPKIFSRLEIWGGKAKLSDLISTSSSPKSRNDQRSGESAAWRTSNSRSLRDLKNKGVITWDDSLTFLRSPFFSQKGLARWQSANMG